MGLDCGFLDKPDRTRIYFRFFAASIAPFSFSRFLFRYRFRLFTFLIRILF